MKHIYCDGSGFGKYCYFCEETQESKIQEVPKKGMTHNQIEYLAVISGINAFPKEDLVIYSDSQLVINQLNYEFKIRFDHLKKLAKQAWESTKDRKVVFEWIPRTKNKAGFLLEGKA